ncbi:MAG: hypothetical protein SNJ54_08010 [Anaerolineae bacterium]
MSKRKLDESTVLTGFVWGVLIGALVMFSRLPDAWLRRRQQLTNPAERRRLIRRIDPVTASIDEGRALAAQRRQGQARP